MKHKKETPDPNRPQVWEGYNPHNSGDNRIRIVYPEGRTEWAKEFYLKFFNEIDLFMPNPCWGWFSDFKTAKEAVSEMKSFDKKGGRKTIFLHNI